MSGILRLSKVIFAALFVVGLIGPANAAGSKKQGIKIDEEIIELLNKPEIKAAPGQIGILKECIDEDAGLFFFITPIMTYLQSASSGPTVTRFFDAEQMDRAIRAKLKKQGTSIEMFCGHIVSETKKVKRGEYTYGDLLDHILVCEKVCGPTMTAMASVYMFNSARHYRGLVRFDFNDSELQNVFQGDESQGFLPIDNESELEAIYKEWVASGRKQKIGLDARASLPGGIVYNDELSRQRLMAVEQWFTQTKDVPVSLIDRKWLGNYGPYIDETVAELYNIEPLFAEYVKSPAAKKSRANGGEVYDGLNQSVAIFLYEDVDIHDDTGTGQTGAASSVDIKAPI